MSEQPGNGAVKRRLYVDPDFPASFNYLTKHTMKKRKRVEWFRPYEIADDPVFVDESFSISDLDQGDTGDCWFVASLGSLIVSGQRQLLDRCIPAGQSFNFKDGYTGMFKFNFWHFGEWREVVVDDRLPTEDGKLITAQNVSQPNEFWVPLMEKAYAKLHGNYENIEGGFSQDAAVDMTGGISESIALKAFKDGDRTRLDELYADLQAMMAKCSILTANIDERKGADERRFTTKGLVCGHAYSILKIEVVTDSSKQQHQLVCIRNPWGDYHEWKGDWSDSSSSWKSVSAAEKKRIKFATGDDGIFWMSFAEFIDYYDSVDICHLTPDDVSRQIAQKENWTMWKSLEFKGSFKDDNGFEVPLGQPGSSRECCMVVSLMQIHEGHECYQNIKISFTISVRDKHEKWRYYVQAEPEESREIVCRYSLHPGLYRIVPKARFSSNTKFLLRVFTDSHK